MGKRRKHKVAVSNNNVDKIKNNRYLSKSICNDLMLMYGREPEWADEVYELIEQTISNLNKFDDYSGYTLSNITTYYPVKYHDVCVDYDYKKLIDTATKGVYTDVMSAGGREVADITYIKCIFQRKKFDTSKNAVIVTHYIEYKTGAKGEELESHFHFCMDRIG